MLLLVFPSRTACKPQTPGDDPDPGLTAGQENSGLCQQEFSGCPVWAGGNPGLWAMPLLGWICFQTKALLALLTLERLRGHQRKGECKGMARLWFEAMGFSLFVWY